MTRQSSPIIGVSIFVAATIIAGTVYLRSDSLAYRINAPVSSDWAKYRNDSYRFEFRYPKEWQLHETRGSDSPLTIELGENPDKPDGIWITLPLPPEPAAQKVAAYKTSDDFVSAEPFETRGLRGFRIVEWDNLHHRSNDAFFFNKPGTNLLFSAAIVSDERTPQLESTLQSLLTSFTFDYTL